MSSPYTWDILALKGLYGFHHLLFLGDYVGFVLPTGSYSIPIHMTPRLLEALHGISSSFIPCDYVRIGTVFKQFPYI